MKRKRRHVMPAVTLRMGVFTLVLWFACIAAMTLAVAQYIFQALLNRAIDFPQYALMVGGLEDGKQPEYPGALEYNMNRAIAKSDFRVQPPSYSGVPGMENMPSMFQSGAEDCETAMIFLNSSGNTVRESGDFMYFRYAAQEQWEAGEEDICGYAWVDLGNPEDERFSVLRTSYAGIKEVGHRVIRMTGTFDGSRFEPSSMAFLAESSYYAALDELSPGWDQLSEPPYTQAELDARGLISWDVRFENPAPEGSVTIYAISPEMTLYEPQGAVQYRETEEHESLLQLLKSMDYYYDKGAMTFAYGASEYSLREMIVFSSWGVHMQTDSEYTVVTAMRASPLRLAAGFLKPVYIATGALALIGFLLVRRSVKKNVARPLTQMIDGMQEGWTHLQTLREKPPRWQEMHTLYTQYEQTREQLHEGKAECARLNKALEYAKTAEQNRRQMTSNIAHELKTPLAVIHSYAEGLKEHIAEHKRERYLDVILSESERMDAMVLELLDLSRLEAGKVKLAHDEFSLSGLVRGIAEKLETAIQEKELQVTFDAPQACLVTADEARIGQVVENFMTNAVKYTPCGGNIAVRISQQQGKTTVSIANDCEALSAEQLARVWDTFYRVQPERDRKGSGLGLAIAKNIVELHGGTCGARSIPTGVEFYFTI